MERLATVLKMRASLSRILNHYDYLIDENISIRTLPPMGFFSARNAITLLMSALGLLELPRVAFAQAALPNANYPFKVLEQHQVTSGQHSITFNRVAPPTFPTPAATPTPTPANPSAAQPAEYNQLLLFSATVYDHQFTVIRRFEGNRSGGWTALSNIDFNYFDIFGFTQADTFYEMIMLLDNESASDADPITSGWLAQARAGLSSSAFHYIIVNGAASASDIQELDALHSYFSANNVSIIQAYQKQQVQNEALALQLKLHPSSPPNTVINYWPIKSHIYSTGQ